VSAEIESTFTSASALTALGEACDIVGLDAAGAELIRFGQNAIYRLKDQPYVVRIARAIDPERVKTEVRVARWLAEAGFPATRVADVGNVAQPFKAAGRLVTVWDLVDRSAERPTMTDLAHVLRGLHDLTPPSGLGLRRFKPFLDLESRLALAPTSVSQEDVDFLRRCGDQLGEAFAALSFELSAGPIHADAHPGNLILATDATVVLGDLECFALGPREYDLVVPAAHRYAFGWLSDSDYCAFVQVYGYDVAQAPCFPVLVAIREVNMTAWLMQNVDESEDIRAEFRQRMSDLRDPTARRSWRVF
jgi:Ser/Thr protein kinase RdoA (MazF antagonist)